MLTVQSARIDCPQSMAVVLLYADAFELPRDDFDGYCAVLVAMGLVCRLLTGRKYSIGWGYTDWHAPVGRSVRCV